MTTQNKEALYQYIWTNDIGTRKELIEKFNHLKDYNFDNKNDDTCIQVYSRVIKKVQHDNAMKQTIIEFKTSKATMLYCFYNEGGFSVDRHTYNKYMGSNKHYKNKNNRHNSEYQYNTYD